MATNKSHFIFGACRLWLWNSGNLTGTLMGRRKRRNDYVLSGRQKEIHLYQSSGGKSHSEAPYQNLSLAIKFNPSLVIQNVTLPYNYTQSSSSSAAAAQHPWAVLSFKRFPPLFSVSISQHQNPPSYLSQNPISQLWVTTHPHPRMWPPRI
jgi:hypothetical protein